PRRHRRPECAPGQGLRARIRRCCDPVRRRHARGARHGLCAEHRARRGTGRAGRPDLHRLRPRSHICRRSCRGGSGVKHRLTRQELLQRAAFGAALASVPGLAAACGGSSGSSGASGTTTQQLASTLRFSNWPLYIDIDPKTKKPGTLEDFTKKTGVKVDYLADIHSNSEYFGKIQGTLSRGESINKDIIVLTDNERYLALMIDKGWAEPLDKDVIPNIANLVDVQKHPGFDPDRKYTLPWQSGMTGIAYNAKLTKPILSIDQLLEDKSLHGKITVLNDFADTLGLVMLANGDDPSKVTDAAFNSALDRIKSASDSGQIRQFTGNDYAGPLSKGDLLACVAWSGD